MSKVKIAGNASGTGTFTIAAPNSNTDRTLTLPDEAGTVLTSASSITQNAGPAFHAYMSGNQTPSAGTWTKLTLNTERFDTNSNFDTSTYRFTPTVTGYYQINGLVSNDYGGSYNGGTIGAAIYLNGSLYAQQRTTNSVSGWLYGDNIVSAVIYFNGSTDYVELYGTNSNGSPVFVGGATRSQFSGVLVRTA